MRASFNLYLLSYAVVKVQVPFGLLFARKALVGSSGLEPPTSRLSGGRSNQLSYEPVCRRIRLFERALKIEQ
jgi:hypothetical protein